MDGFDIVRQETFDFDRNVRLTGMCWLIEGLCVALAGRQLLRLSRLRRAGASGSWPEAHTIVVGPWVKWLAAAAGSVIVMAFASSLQRARAIMPHFPPPPDLDFANAMSHGLSVQLSTLALTAVLLPWPILTALVALGLARCAQLRSRGLARAAQLALSDPPASQVWCREPGPTPLAVLALLLILILASAPLWYGIREFDLEYIQGLATVANLPDGADRAASVEAVSSRLRELLTDAWRQTAVGLCVGLLSAAVLTWFTSTDRRRKRLSPSVPAHDRADAWVWSWLMVVAALYFAMITEPLRRENSMPWHWAAPERASTFWVPIPTPELTPRDGLPDFAPVLAIEGQQLQLDGRALASAAELVDSLDILKRNWSILHPGAAFKGDLIVACSPDATGRDIDRALAAAVAEESRSLWFAFRNRVRMERPVIGTLLQPFATGAQVTAGAAPDGAVTIEPAQHSNCAALCAEIVQQRQAQRPVFLHVAAR
jgi:hypothetical protein